MQPTPSDVHVNAPLTNVSIAYLQDQSEFIADRAFPAVAVSKQSDRYFSYTKGNWFRSKSRKRGPAEESAGSGYELDNTPNYFADVWAIHKDVDDDTRANADSPIDVDRDATEFVTRDLILTREVQWAANFFGTGSGWTGTSTGSNVTPSTLWDLPGSTPIADIRTQLRSLKAKNGFRGNKIVMADTVWDLLQDHPDFLERIKYTQTAIVTTGLLAAVLGLDEVLVGGAVVNTVNEGQTDSLDFLFGKHVLCLHAPARPGLMTPSAGYIFNWTGRVGGFMRVLRFRMEWLKSDRVEGEASFAQKQIAVTMGAMLINVMS
jgi:hypothetical protein